MSVPAGTPIILTRTEYLPATRTHRYPTPVARETRTIPRQRPALARRPGTKLNSATTKRVPAATPTIVTRAKPFSKPAQTPMQPGPGRPPRDENRPPGTPRHLSTPGAKLNRATSNASPRGRHHRDLPEPNPRDPTQLRPAPRAFHVKHPQGPLRVPPPRGLIDPTAFPSTARAADQTHEPWRHRRQLITSESTVPAHDHHVLRQP